jgi:hypothetical protein
MTNQSSHQIHLFTYAIHAWNMTLERFILGAEGYELYASIHSFLPEDLERIDPEFANEFQEILSLPRGGGYWLWKFPLLEYMLSLTPPQEFNFYLKGKLTNAMQGSAQGAIVSFDYRILFSISMRERTPNHTSRSSRITHTKFVECKTSRIHV